MSNQEQVHVIAATAIFLANGPQAGLGSVGSGSAAAWGVASCICDVNNATKSLRISSVPSSRYLCWSKVKRLCNNELK